MLALAAVVGLDGPVVLVIALTMLASVAGLCGEARCPGHASPARRGIAARRGQRAPAHRSGPRHRARPGYRRRPARRGPGLRGLPRQWSHVRGVRAARVDDRLPRRSRQRAGGRTRPHRPRPAYGRGDALCDSAVPRGGDGRADLRRPDRSARGVRGALARPRQRRLRADAHRTGRRRAAEHDRERPACGEPASGARVSSDRCPRLRDSAGLRRNRPAGSGPSRHGDRRRRARGVRGGRRDDAHPNRSVGGARAGDGRVRRFLGSRHGRRRPDRADPDRRDLAGRQPARPGRPGAPRDIRLPARAARPRRHERTARRGARSSGGRGPGPAGHRRRSAARPGAARVRRPDLPAAAGCGRGRAGSARARVLRRGRRPRGGAPGR